MHKMYDLYLSLGCRTLPDLEALTQKVPMLADPALHTRILKRSPGPGFLGLDLPDTIAVSLLQRLKSAKASGCRLPSAYRLPLISIEQAAPMAEQAMGELKAARLPYDTLGPVRFLREQPTCWTFGAVSEQLVKEGRIPGVLHACVDKLDGHLWTREEFDRLWGEQEGKHA